MIHDGSKDKPSTNGTWLYINTDSVLVNDFVFKANYTIFRAKILN